MLSTQIFYFLIVSLPQTLIGGTLPCFITFQLQLAQVIFPLETLGF